MIKTYWVGLFFLLFTQSLFATSPWLEKEWLDLMFYQKKSNSQYESSVENPAYFLSSRGKYEVKAEYEAAYHKTKAQDPEFKRKFPLRYKLLADQNNIAYQPAVTVDTEVDQVLLSFPTRYMGNPSSIFGHLFLVLKKKTGLLSSNIYHFMADPGNAGGFDYIYGGLNGAFKGQFRKESFHKTIKTYQYEDDREIIYYSLKLDAAALERLQLLTIDLKQSSFDYFFKDQNCAYFIGTVLNISLKQEIVNLNYFVAPSDIINRLIELGYISKLKKRSSSTDAFLKLYNRLKPEEKKNIATLLTQKMTDPKQISLESLAAFLSISEYVLNNQPHLAAIIRYNRVLAYQRLADTPLLPIRKALKTYPIEKMSSRYFDFTSIKDNRWHIRWSPIYYESDFDDAEFNRVNVVMPGLQISKDNQVNLTVRFLDIVNKKTYNSFFGNSSWKTQTYLHYSHKLDMDFSFDYGYGRPLWALDFVDAMLGIRLSSFNPLEQKSLRRLALYPAVSSTARKEVAKRWWLQAAYEYSYNAQYFSVGVHKSWGHFRIKSDYYFSPDTDNWAQVSLQFLY